MRDTLILGLLASAMIISVSEATALPGADVPDDHPFSAVDSSFGWQRPRFEERRDEREQMVATQMAGISDKRVLDALREVPRHMFIPDNVKPFAYHDGPLPIGEGQTISQPFMVAAMTEAADIQPGDKVLEIGTGSGYQAAVLTELTPNVFTIELLETLANRARTMLDSLGYTTITSGIGDGYEGWPDEAPFDAIVVTAAPAHIPSPLVDQIAPGGCMVIPVGKVQGRQQLLKISRDIEGNISQETLFDVRFVPMIGHDKR